MVVEKKSEPVPDLAEEAGHNKETGVVEPSSDAENKYGSDSDEAVHKDAQAGVQAVEGMASVWPKTALIIAYVWIWVIFFVYSMQSQVIFSLNPYVTSSFQSHSLTPTVSIFSSIIGGVGKLTLAKVLDVWGRPQGFGISIFFLTIGLIMMAGCNNVETYAAAQVFWYLGFNGIDYSLSIFIADTSHLKNRGLMLAFASSPYIITTWIGPYIAQSTLQGPGFRWGFGIFCIVMPVVCAPLLGLFTYYHRKADKLGLIPKRDSGRTIPQSIVHYAREFDVLGLLLITAGITLFLLPFNIYSYQTEQWKAPIIICFLIFGFLLIVAFALWEKFWAPVKFLPYELFLDRTFMGACVLAGSVFVSFYCWDSYFSSFLQVVNNLDVTKAGYLTNTYTMGSCIFSFFVGWWIRRTGHFKWICLGFGVPFTILGVGLMLKFRQPDVNVGYIVMCQIFIAFAGGTIVICEQTAAMAVVSHQYVAVVLAIEGMFSSIGNGIGSSIAAAIWQGIFPKKLAEYLPESEQANLIAIYGDITTQLSYPVGSEARRAIQHAYADAQRMMIIAGTCVLVVSFTAVLFWKDINVKERKQVKGRVV
ncbi:major facilitator superfamily domain-containing protein [Mariannaea sp. PMI_226]|nr:major facilitator superfamily domain-containing protein [Mariannaea sp. PMI_226]